MFETDEFKNQLAASISAEAGNNNIERYETRIVDYLQGIATETENLEARQMKKGAKVRGGIPDALSSAKELTREASKYAAAEKRKVITLTDIESACKAKFCQVWPFCKK
jgi:histone H3/H4